MTIILSSTSTAPDWTSWSSFYDYILPELNGVTTSVVDFALRQVCIEFCEQTSIHTKEVTAINVVADTATYTLTSPVTETEPYQAKAAWFDNVPLDFAPIEALNSASSYWADDEAVKSRAFTQRQPDEIILYPIPTDALASGLRVELILRPTSSATGLTGWIANRYINILASGVKGRLMAQPNKPWTNPDFAGVYIAQYEAGKARGRADANRSLTRAALSVRMRPAA